MYYFFENRKAPITVAPFSRLGKAPHIHPHLEMIYLEKGSSMASLDGKKHLIEAGDLFLSFPNQIHCYYDRSEVSGNIAIFAPEMLPDLQELFAKKIPVSPVVKKDLLPPDIGDGLVRIREQIRSGEHYGQLAAKGALLVMLAEILQQMQLIDSPVNPDSTKSVLLYCMENYKEPLSLEKMAQALHLNKYYISHIFKGRMGISFTDFLNQIRVDQACRLLSKDCSITDVAYSSGFSSIRTFNRVFSQCMGVTPTVYIHQKDNSDNIIR